MGRTNLLCFMESCAINFNYFEISLATSFFKIPLTTKNNPKFQATHVSKEQEMSAKNIKTP